MNKPLKRPSIPGDDAADSPTGNRSDSQSRRGEDDALVARAQDGDEAAFRQLFERYHRRAYSLALGIVRNPDDALDVVQDAFIKAHRYLPKFQGTSSFYTWFYRIVTNLAIDHIRKHKRARHVDFNDAISHGEDTSAVGNDNLLPSILGANPGKAMMRKEIRDQIAEALDGLSDNHRTVILLREVHGLSYEDMAKVMECSKGTIMSRLFHARKNMQKKLLEYLGGDKELKA